MATESQGVTEIPTAIVGISEDTDYTFQNVGAQSVYIATADAAPEVGGSAFILNPGQPIIMSAPSGESIFVWSKNGNSGVTFETVS